MRSIERILESSASALITAICLSEHRMSDFSKYAAGKLKRKAEIKRLNDAKSIQDNQMLDKATTYFWSELRAKLKNACGEINQEPDIEIRLDCDDRTPNCIVVSRSDTASSIAGTLGNHQFIFKGENGSRYNEILSVKLTLAGTDWYLVDSEQHPFTGAEQAATKIITALLEI
jgi:hypothetical protein